MRRRGSLLLQALLLSWLAAGCAGIGNNAGAFDGTGAAPDGVMTADRMERVFASQVGAIEGPSGAIRTQIDGVNIYLISDPKSDRMRIVAGIAYTEGLDKQFLTRLLQANFHSTLDARYAISEGAVYSVFMHPISSLTETEIESALAQVLSLAKTFGNTFSSGKLVFGAGSSGG